MQTYTKKKNKADFIWSADAWSEVAVSDIKNVYQAIPHYFTKARKKPLKHFRLTL